MRTKKEHLNKHENSFAPQSRHGAKPLWRRSARGGLVHRLSVEQLENLCGQVLVVLKADDGIHFGQLARVEVCAAVFRV